MGTLPGVSELPIAYARVSTDEQDLTAHPDALAGLGEVPERIYVDSGYLTVAALAPGALGHLAPGQLAAGGVWVARPHRPSPSSSFLRPSTLCRTTQIAAAP
jgi:hypothetical protein